MPKPVNRLLSSFASSYGEPGTQLSGVLPVFQTPFSLDGSIDFVTLAKELEWLFDNGANGVVFAMVSELLRLSSEERDEVASATCKLVDRRGAVIIGVGAESTPVAVRHAKHAADCGADAVMAAPPAVCSATDEQLFGYYLAIGRAVDIPIIVQDASSYVGASLSLNLQVSLLEQLGERVMFKPEASPIGPRLTQLRERTGGRARVFEGTGGLHLVDSFRRGAVGTMPAADVVWALSIMWAALGAGDFDKAYRIAGPLALMLALQDSLDNYVAVEKYLLVKQGVFTSEDMRGPNDVGFDERARHEVDLLFYRLQDAVSYE